MNRILPTIEAALLAEAMRRFAEVCRAITEQFQEQGKLLRRFKHKYNYRPVQRLDKRRR